MICIRCSKEIPITCIELAYISIEGRPYSYMPLCDECNKSFMKFIDNAPTVEPDVNCSHCNYWKFSQAIINGFVDLMAARGIESIEELEEELHRLNQNKQEDAEND